jgi:hypothetical protein
MITQQEFRMEEATKRWNIFFILLFIVLATLLINSLDEQSWYFLEAISFGEIIVIVLAVARLIRLFCYDNITLFLREFFLDVRIVKQAEGGVEQYERIPSENPFKHTVYKLLNCPWCTGIWITLGLVWVYSYYPVLYFLFVILAISQLAGMLQLSTNLLGWSAEHKKNQANKAEC